MPWSRDPSIGTEDQPEHLSAKAGDYTADAWALAAGTGAWLVSTGDGPKADQLGSAPSLAAPQPEALRALKRRLVATLYTVGRLERLLDADEACGSRPDDVATTAGDAAVPRCPSFRAV